jgi:hypothetical protein
MQTHTTHGAALVQADAYMVRALYERPNVATALREWSGEHPAGKVVVLLSESNLFPGACVYAYLC